ncbi:hypothetical protein ACFVQB_14220 [Paenibacillus sp. NPDC057886]
MRADNDFLVAMANKLNEIAEKTNDIETENELDELVQVIINSMGR